MNTVISFLKTLLYIFLPVGLTLITLKLAGFIDWSWSLVCLPFWLPMSLLFLVLIVSLALTRMKLLHFDINGSGNYGTTEDRIKFLYIDAKGYVWLGKEKENE